MDRLECDMQQCIIMHEQNTFQYRHDKAKDFAYCTYIQYYVHLTNVGAACVNLKVTYSDISV